MKDKVFISSVQKELEAERLALRYLPSPQVAESTDNRPTIRPNRPMDDHTMTTMNLSIIYRQFVEIYRLHRCEEIRDLSLLYHRNAGIYHLPAQAKGETA